MPSSTLETFAAWSNYHLTIGEQPAPGQPPAMTIKQMHKLHCADVFDLAVGEAMNLTSAVLMETLHEIAKMRTEQGPLTPVPGPFASGMVGRGWSFSPLIGTPTAQIMTEGLSWFKMLPDELRPQGPAQHATLCVCGGGTRLRELVTWAERQGHSIITSGTHLGPSIAGGFATASHGSRLGHGGLQNLVRGMHIVTGEGDHVFLQHPDFPVFTDAAIASLVAEVRNDADHAPTSIVCRAITDAEHFDNALVHLGCMGIVNAVVIELTPKEDLAVMAWKHPIDSAWLERIGKGDFQGIADQMHADGREPLFYELTINPLFDPDEPGEGGQAMADIASHLVYFAADDAAPRSKPGKRPVPADAVATLAKDLFALSPDNGPFDFFGEKNVDDTDPDIIAALKQLVDYASVFEAYIGHGVFSEPSLPFDPAKAIKRGSWGEIHGDEITGAVPGALYNASFAIDLADVPVAVPAIRRAVAGLSPSFLFTLRFVKNPAGNLAFTRFPDCAVIEIDGLSPLICELVLEVFREHGPVNPHLERGLQLLKDNLPKGAALVRGALDEAKIEYSMHWAKLGGLDGAKVAADFGPRPGQPSKIDAWQKTREVLLPDPVARDMFRNGAAVRYGLVPALSGEKLPD